MKNGGARPGAGRPKGKVGSATLATQAARKRFMERFEKIEDRLFDVAEDLALGIVVEEEVTVGNDDAGKPIREKRYYKKLPDKDIVKELLQQGIGKAPQDIAVEANTMIRYNLKRAGDSNDIVDPTAEALAAASKDDDDLDDKD